MYAVDDLPSPLIVRQEESEKAFVPGELEREFAFMLDACCPAISQPSV